MDFLTFNCARSVFVSEAFSFGPAFSRLQNNEPTEPNQALEPTGMLVTDRAFARSAPSTPVAKLKRSAKK
jgi:hypothetical protein